MAQQPNPQDVLQCQAMLYEWAESYDTKDAERLVKCVAPTVRIDYTHVMNKLWEAMPTDDFVKMAFDAEFLGNPRLKTQHLIGMASWEQTGEGEMTSYQQMRVAHQRYKDDALTEVDAKMHAHGRCTTWYRKCDGVWKWAGMMPDVRWYEFDSTLGNKSVFDF
ncbi:putative scytalone dehydratase [Xylariaceae sp. FL0804]|nr:putative scytalone dehydratase [Xylariaceae sp. FL0804]